MGSCIGYQYFAASSINFIMCEYSEGAHCYGNRLFMVFLTIPVILFSFLGSYKALAYLSIPSIIIAIVGILTTFVYSYDRIKTSSTPVLEEVNWIDFSAVLGRMGVAMHVFNGTPSILNIRSEAQHKSHYPLLLKTSILFLLGLFTIYGATSYLAYKNDTQPIFIMTLVPLDPLILFMFVCFSFNSVTSYPV